MRGKRRGILAVLLAVFFLFTACAKEARKEPPARKMPLPEGFAADNSQPLSALLTKEYEAQALRDFFGPLPSSEEAAFGPARDGLDVSIENVNRNFPIECLRYNQNDYYSVYKVAGGGYFYVFWDHVFSPLPGGGWSQEPDRVVAYFTAHIVSPKKAGDFRPLKEGVSTAEDVALVDPALEFMFVMSHAIYSYSLLEKGAIMEIQYETPGKLNGRRDMIVKRKEEVPKEKAIGDLASILPEDLP